MCSKRGRKEGRKEGREGGRKELREWVDSTLFLTGDRK
jgi:hypothetical protein